MAALPVLGGLVCIYGRRLLVDGLAAGDLATESIQENSEGAGSSYDVTAYSGFSSYSPALGISKNSRLADSLTHLGI